MEGSKGGKAVKIAKQWMIDTGATVTVVTKSVGDRFDLNPTGASARATTGGAGILMKTGMTVVFTVRDTSGTHIQQKAGSLAVGVKPDNQGEEILGMDQISKAAAHVTWDPVALDGDLAE